MGSILLAAQSSFDWNELLDPPTIVFVVGGIIAITAIVGGIWRGHAATRYQYRLKTRMLDQGFSAQEIERVIRAAPSSQESAGDKSDK